MFDFSLLIASPKGCQNKLIKNVTVKKRRTKKQPHTLNHRLHLPFEGRFSVDSHSLSADFKSAGVLKSRGLREIHLQAGKRLSSSRQILAKPRMLSGKVNVSTPLTIL